MLDIGHERSVIDELWSLVEIKPVRPGEEADFFAATGPVPRFADTKRRFHRFYFRGKAILVRGEDVLGAYTRDVSREGIGFLSPVQLLPKERVQLRIVGTNQLLLEVTRCRRLGECCYQCGARFLTSV